MDQHMWHHAIRHGLVRVFYPCLMAFGTIGNILCLKILLRKRFRRQSTCQYLCVIAVIDIIFIYMRSLRYLYRLIYRVDLRNTSLWTCRTFIFFSSTLSHFASWILVIVSFDRYFIIRHLFLRRRVGWRVIKSTCILILIISIFNLHYFRILGRNILIPNSIDLMNTTLTNETSNYTISFVCIVPSQYKEFFYLYVPIFDLLFVAIIPFCLMMLTNIGIIRTTMHSNMLCTTSRKQQRNNRLTIMLLSVTLAFMLLTCPAVIYICVNRLKSSTAYSDAKLLLVDLLEALWYTKHAMNFILYTLSGQDFRREFIKLFLCSRRKASNPMNNRQQNRQHGFLGAVSMTSDGTSLGKKRVVEGGKARETNEINDFLPIVVSKISQRKHFNQVKGNIDSSFVAFRANSNTRKAKSTATD